MSVALRSRRQRDWLAILGIATCTLLVLVIVSAFRSASGAMGGYVDQPGADLWVGSPGTDNLIRGAAGDYLSVEYRDSLLEIPGVVAADPLLKGFMTVTTLDSVDPRRASLLSIGYRSPTGLGGPPRLATGRAPRGGREVALDRAAAYRLGVEVGDTVAIANRKITVVGTTLGTNLLATQFLFADLAVTALLSQTRDKASFFVIELAPSADPADLVGAIRSRFPSLEVHTRAEFLAQNEAEISSGFIPLLGLMGGLGLLAAAVLVALLVNNATADRYEDIVVLFALGAEQGWLLRGILRGTLRQVGLGTGSGVVLAVALAHGLDRFHPVIPLTLIPFDIILVAGCFAAASIVGATLPIRSLRTVDPMEAFRA